LISSWTSTAALVYSAVPMVVVCHLSNAACSAFASAGGSTPVLPPELNQSRQALAYWIADPPPGPSFEPDEP
jgi:hypothetical protein